MDAAHMNGVAINRSSGPVFPITKHKQNGSDIAHAFMYIHTASATRPQNTCFAEGRVKSFRF